MIREYVEVKAAAAAASSWVPPVDWIDISVCANNEILMLVTNFSQTCFKLNVGAGAGTFSIDWGDGVIENALVGNMTTIFAHTHTAGGTLSSEGFYTWKVRVFNVSDNITGLTMYKPMTYSSSFPYITPLLGINIGAQYISSYSHVVKNGTYSVDSTSLCFAILPNILSASSFQYAFMGCSSLKKVVLPSSWGTATNLTYMFSGCIRLTNIDLPSSWGNVTNITNMFQTCRALSTLKIPTSWGLVVNISFMFQDCQTLTNISLPTSWGGVTSTNNFFTSCFLLESVTLPTSWGNVANAYSMFQDCNSLRSIVLPNLFGSITSCLSMFQNCFSLECITLPTTWGSVGSTSNMFSYCKALKEVTLPAATYNGLISCDNMFEYCACLKTINNLSFLGSNTQQTSMSNIFMNCYLLSGVYTVNTRLSAFKSTSLYPANGGQPDRSFRLTNPNSLFGGISPEINLTNSNISAANIDILFNDLPTVVGKTINITGCTGAATCTRTIATAKGWTVTG